MISPTAPLPLAASHCRIVCASWTSNSFALMLPYPSCRNQHHSQPLLMLLSLLTFGTHASVMSAGRLLSMVPTSQMASPSRPPPHFLSVSPVTCIVGKHPRQLFSPSEGLQSSTFLDLVHADVAGPMLAHTPHGHRYFLVILDNFTHVLDLHLLTTKDQALDTWESTRRHWETKYSCQVKNF